MEPNYKKMNKISKNEGSDGKNFSKQTDEKLNENKEIH